MTHFTEEETEAQKRGESRDWDSVVRGVHPAESLEGDFGSILLGHLETPYAIDQGCPGGCQLKALLAFCWSCRQRVLQQPRGAPGNHRQSHRCLLLNREWDGGVWMEQRVAYLHSCPSKLLF